MLSGFKADILSIPRWLSILIIFNVIQSSLLICSGVAKHLGEYKPTIIEREGAQLNSGLVIPGSGSEWHRDNHKP